MMYSASKSSIFLLLLLLNLQLVFGQNSFPDFYVGAFSGMLNKAKATDKPFVVYFTAEECRACEKMESGTLVDNAFVAYLNEYFLIQEVDGRSLMEGGIEIAEQFGVNTFPTLMFFNSDGTPLHKIVGFVKPEHLLATLEQEYENAQKLKEMGNQSSMFEVAHLSHVDISKPIAPKLFKQTQYATAYNEGNNQEEEELRRYYASLSQVRDLASLPNAGYGIQLGVFSDKKKLAEAIESYQQRLSDVYVTVETEVNGKRCYKLLVGVFDNGQMAMIRQQQLENDLIASGSVMNYNELRKTSASSESLFLAQTVEPN